MSEKYLNKLEDGPVERNYRPHVDYDKSSRNKLPRSQRLLAKSQENTISSSFVIRFTKEL